MKVWIQAHELNNYRKLQKADSYTSSVLEKKVLCKLVIWKFIKFSQLNKILRWMLTSLSI